MFAWVIAQIGLCSCLVAAPFIKNAETLRQRYGLDKYPFSPEISQLKIVVIDKGFRGFLPGKDQLPPTAKLYSDFVKDFPENFIKSLPKEEQRPLEGKEDTEHGLKMAEIAWAMSGKSSEGPEFHLVEAPTFSQFKRAVKFANWLNADIVLYSQNVDFATNFDGTGPYNKVIDEYARKKNHFWINSAGNYQGMAYHGKVQPSRGNTGFLKFNQKGYLEFKNNLDDYPVTITLSWNSQSDDEEAGTEQDLDLFVYNQKNDVYSYTNEEGKQAFAKSEFRQVLKKEKMESNESVLPTEVVSIPALKAGTYRIYVRAVSNNFDADSRLMVTITSSSRKEDVVDLEKGQIIPVIQFVDASAKQTILTPADNRYAISVGELSPRSSIGPTADGRAKPEVILDQAQVVYSDSGEPLGGTSVAAAMFAGMVAVLKTAEPSLTRDNLLSYVQAKMSGPSSLGPIATITEIKAEEFEAANPGVVQAIYQQVRQTPLKYGRYRDGQYVIGFKFSPYYLKWFKGVNESDRENFEYFLLPKLKASSGTWNQDTVQRELFTFSRNRLRDASSSPQSYPWMLEEFKDYSLRKSDYIEVRRLRDQAERDRATEDEKKVLGKIWKTPSPKELADWVKR